MSGTSSLMVLARYLPDHMVAVRKSSLVGMWICETQPTDTKGTHSGNREFETVSKYNLSMYPVYPVFGAHTVNTRYNWSDGTAGYVIPDLMDYQLFQMLF